MTIFDYLTFGIDTRFRLEDICAIPKPILEQWWYKDIRQISPYCIIAVGYTMDPVNIERFAVLNLHKYQQVEVLSMLKRRILEYDHI